MTIFNWQLNQVRNAEEALSWEPQFSDNIDVDQILLDENITVSNIYLEYTGKGESRYRGHLWTRQLNKSKPSSLTLDD